MCRFFSPHARAGQARLGQSGEGGGNRTKVGKKCGRRPRRRGPRLRSRGSSPARPPSSGPTPNTPNIPLLPPLCVPVSHLSLIPLLPQLCPLPHLSPSLPHHPTPTKCPSPPPPSPASPHCPLSLTSSLPLSIPSSPNYVPFAPPRQIPLLPTLCPPLPQLSPPFPLPGPAPLPAARTPGQVAASPRASRACTVGGASGSLARGGEERPPLPHHLLPARRQQEPA